jgi:hypothetical protein
MLHFCIGLPSGFAEWCDILITCLMTQGLGPTETIGVDSIEEFTIAVIKARSPHMVMGLRQPRSNLSRTVLEAGIPFILAVDDPRLALHYLVARHGVDFLEAVRMVARSCAGIVTFASAPGALVLRAEQQHWESSLATAIAHHLSLPSDASVIAEALETAAARESSAGRDTFQAWWASLDEAGQTIANSALAAYVEYFGGSDLGPITWERELFFIGDEPGRQGAAAATRPIDITGRPRYLIFGPFLSLPPGNWSADIALGFSAEAAELSYVVEAGAPTRLAATTVDPRGAREMEINLPFVIDETVSGPLEIRVWNERTAFDGRLALGYVTLARRPEIRDDARQFFATALERGAAPVDAAISSGE